MKPVFMPDFLAGIEKIQEARNSRKLVILAGAGVSAESSVPTWSDLIAEMRRSADIPKAEQDYLKIAQMYFNQRQSKEYYDTIRRVLKYRKTVPNRNHRTLFDLAPEHIITTNYEDLFEQVVEQEALAYSFVRRDQELPTAANTNLVIKMHGDLDMQNIVLKEDDYINYNQNFPLIHNYVGGLFASRLVLFVGFSFSDWNLKLILQQVRNVLSNHAQPAYMLTGNQLTSAEIQYFKERGVIPLIYTPAIEDYLKANNKFKEAPELTDRGRNLFQFLTFIKSYDAFLDRYKQAHVLDQMYSSLRRFDELPFLAPHSFPNYFPFRKLHTFRRYELNDSEVNSSHQVTNFFTLISKDNKVTLPLSKEQIKRAKLNLVDDYADKLHYVISRLNDSYITTVESVNILLDQSTHTNCSCQQCAFIKLNFSLLFQATNNQPVHAPVGQTMQEELRNALANCKLGRFKEAYYLFQDIAKRAWRTDKFLIYTICLVNINRISQSWNFQLAISSDITDEIQAMDIHKLINQLTVEPIIGEQIKDIVDNTFFAGLSIDIKKTIDDIKKTHRHFDNNGKRWGGDAEYVQLQWYLLQLHSQYNENFIYYEEFSDFEDLVTLSLDGLLTAYCTNPNYHFRLNAINSIFLIIAILHCDPDRFREVFNLHNLPEIKLLEGQSELTGHHLASVAVNFFNSVEGGPWGENNEFITATQTNNFLGEKIRKVFSNLLTTLAVAEITNKKLEIIIPAFINFLEHQRCLDARDGVLAALALFINRRIKDFSREQAEQLLGIVMSDSFRVEGFDVHLGSAMNRMRYTISNKPLLARLVFLFETYERRLESNSIYYLYSLVGDKYQQKFRQLIEDKLRKQFDLFTYTNAIEFKIISIDPLYDTFINYMLQKAENLKSKQVKSTANELENMAEVWAMWEGQKEFILLFSNVGKYNFNVADPRLQQIAEVSPYYQWLLNFQHFDYSIFDPEWFEKEPTAYFLEQMKNHKQIKMLLREYIRNHKFAKKTQQLIKLYFNIFEQNEPNISK